ncbi:MAG: hypothetical protein PF503_16200 [Desulfobacula sp.]|nr:hypothetical protein [Desulfobacula sp.]
MPAPALNEFSAREIQAFAEDLEKTKKMAEHYMKGSISDFSRSQYLNFFKDFFYLMKGHSKPSTRIAFLNADVRNFQGIPAIDENPENAILAFRIC